MGDVIPSDELVNRKPKIKNRKSNIQNSSNRWRNSRQVMDVFKFAAEGFFSEEQQGNIRGGVTTGGEVFHVAVVGGDEE
jgi:hypothetical protein